MSQPASPKPPSAADERLLAAARSGDLAAAKAALKDGARADARDENGKTGLHLVISQKEYGGYNDKGREMLSLFLNRKLPIDAPDNDGATALHLAMLDEGYTTSKYKIEDLVTFGADVNARDNTGRTPLHVSALYGNKTEGLKTLLAKPVSVNARDNAGVTPLHLAAQRGDHDVVKHLLNKGANATLLTNDGKSVGDYAEDNGHEYLAQVLRAETVRHAQILAEREAAEKRAQDPWTLLAPDRVSLVSHEKKIGYKLTEVFNFSARTYTKISQNIQTKAEAVTVKGFDEFTDKSLLEKAHDNLTRLGGVADREVINHAALEKPKKPNTGFKPKN